MNIVQTFRELFKYWDQTNHCNQCWEFEAPMTEALVNASLPKSDQGECCYRVFLVTYSIRENRSYNTSGLVTDRYNEHTFELLVLKESDPGRNMDLEEQHTAPAADPIQYTPEEGRWEVYHYPVLECFQDSILEELCTLTGKSYRNTLRTWSPVLDYADQNYDGWRIRMALQDYKPEDSTLYNYDYLTAFWSDNGEAFTGTLSIEGDISGAQDVEFTEGLGIILNTQGDTSYTIAPASDSNSDEVYIGQTNSPLALVADNTITPQDGEATFYVIRNSFIDTGGVYPYDNPLPITAQGQVSFNSYSWNLIAAITSIEDSGITPGLDPGDSVLVNVESGNDEYIQDGEGPSTQAVIFNTTNIGSNYPMKILIEPLAAPTNLGAVGAGRGEYNFEWQWVGDDGGGDGSVIYRLQVHEGSDDFSDPDHEEIGVLNNGANISADTYAPTQGLSVCAYWRIRAELVDGSRVSQWTEGEYFDCLAPF